MYHFRNFFGCKILDLGKKWGLQKMGRGLRVKEKWVFTRLVN